MRAKRFAFLVLCMLCPLLIQAETLSLDSAAVPPTLTAHYPEDGEAALVIGKLAIAGLGDVTFLASRAQTRVFIRAVTAAGSPIGSAESVIALSDTPIFIRSPRGLYKVVIHWTS